MVWSMVLYSSSSRSSLALFSFSRSISLFTTHTGSILKSGGLQKWDDSTARSYSKTCDTQSDDKCRIRHNKAGDTNNKGSPRQNSRKDCFEF
mmetsp:Transcript_21111/g.46046  ORF Transcript_21111/g.46046 Transcript_21111/m.46046 type:complete len:92 (-) Transcript_21111:2157-2432(-)